MSLRIKTLILVGFMLLLAVLIVGVYHELVVNTVNLRHTSLPVPTIQPLNGGAYPGVDNQEMAPQAYPYPTPMQGKNQLNKIPLLPAPNNFN